MTDNVDNLHLDPEEAEVFQADEQETEETLTDAEVAQLEEGADREVIRYVGTSGIREITREDWLRAGVDPDSNPETITWDAENGYKVPRARLGFLTEEQFTRFIGNDAELVVEGSPEEAEGQQA